MNKFLIVLICIFLSVDCLAEGDSAGRTKLNTLVDPRDGRHYKTVTIGKQTWMAENLNYATANSYCYKDVADSCAKYGRFYTWAAAMDSVYILRTSGYECGFDRKCSMIKQVQGVCPNDWHLPTQEDWLDLINEVGGASKANNVLKSKTGWLGIGNGTDDFGFAVLPAGDKDLDDRFLIGNDAAFWSSTGYGTLNAYYMGLEHNKVNVESISKVRGLSVRCVKNVNGGENGRSPLSFRKNPFEHMLVRPDSVVVGSFTDSRDGQTYGTVMIGSQTWMSENLNYDTGDSFCSDKENSCNKYHGCCYKWNEANDACPAGWRLPTEADWDTLFESVGGKDRAGNVLKSSIGWGGWLCPQYYYYDGDSYYYDGDSGPNNPCGGGSDNYGFSVIPSSYSYHPNAEFWVSSGNCFMDFDDSGVYKKKAENKKVSVRCIKGNGNSNSRQKSKLPRKKKSLSSSVFPPSKVIKDSFVDFRDGQTYKTVTIGKQTWFAQNLNYITSDSYCYDDNVNNCTKYGRLYKQEIAKTACPNGWHLPTTSEWNALMNEVGGLFVARLKLRAAEGWFNGKGTDDYGFSALPAGKRLYHGTYRGKSIESYFATDSYDYVKLDYAYTYNIFTRGGGYDGDGYSVRCVKNGGEIIESSSSKKSASSDSKYEQNDWFSEF